MQSFKFKRVELSDGSLMEQIFRLRYQVYGRERNFISQKDYPDQLESDEHDEHAVHVAAINRFGEVIGSLRIIFNHRIILPIEHHVAHINLSTPIPDVLCFAEMSRLVISKEMRQRNNGHVHQAGFHKQGFDSSQKGFLRFAKPLAFGLCQKAYEVSLEEGVTHWLCLMEKGLHALLKMYGFPFCQIGNEVDYMGKVFPYITHIQSLKPALEQYYGESPTPAFSSPLQFSLS